VTKKENNCILNETFVLSQIGCCLHKQNQDICCIVLKMKLFRKINIKYFFAVAAIFFAANSVFASEKMVFEMYLMGKSIGTLTVTHSKLEDGSDHYFLTSKARAKVLWVEREQNTKYEIVYKNGMLIRSSYSYIENTGNNIICDIKLSNGNYEVKRNGKTFNVSGKPSHSIISV
jgi:hypothetical protein